MATTPSAPNVYLLPKAGVGTLEYLWYAPSVNGNAVTNYELTLSPGPLVYTLSTINRYRVTGLSNGQTYEASIRATCNFPNWGPSASFFEFQPGSPPSQGVASLNAAAITMSTGAALVSWTPPVTTPDATIFWYAIYGYTSANRSTPFVSYTAGGQTQSNYFITGLDNTSNYYFTVSAVNCPGWSVPLSTNTIVFLQPFLPTQLGSLVQWLDSTDLTTLFQNNTGTTPVTATGQNVAFWRDKSGQANNVLSNASIAVPTYGAALINNCNALNFASNRMLRTSGTYIKSSNVTFITVGMIKNTIATWGTWWGHFTSPDHDVNAITMRRVNNTNAMNWHTNNDNTVMNLTYTADSPVIYSATMSNGSSMFFQQYNTASSASVSGTVTQTINTTAAPISVGQSSGATEFINGPIGEILYYHQVLTPFDRQKVEGYLAWKWGIQSNLPLIHPFRSTIPMSNSVFTPRSFSSLQLWLDGVDPLGTGIQPANGAAVSTWVDKSGFSNSATAGGTTPTYIGFESTIKFGGAGYYNTNYSASLSNESLFVVFEKITGSTTESGLVGQSSNGGRFFAHRTTSNRLEGSTYNVGFGSIGPTNSAFLNTTYIAELITSNRTQTSFVTGGSQGTSVTVTITAGLTSKIGGAFNAGAPNSNNYLTGNIYEVIGYNTALSAPDRQTVEGYLAWKWGIQSNLATTHPYRYNNPGIVNFTQITPTSFGGLQLWLDASQLTGLSNGGTLTSWTDRTSNSYVGTAVASPTFITNSMNSLPVVRFNGTSQYINFGSNILNIGSNSGIATFTVLKFNNTSNGGIIGKTVAGPFNARWALLREAGSNKFLVDVNGTAPEARYADVLTTNQLYEALWDRQQLFIYRNGALQASATQASTSNLSNTAPVWLGAYPNSAGSAPLAGFFMSGDIAEVLVYMSNVTPFIRQQIEGYLSWKWGLQGNLASTHPYFAGPPQQAYTTFNPLLYTGLQLWLDAADTTTLTGATAVSQWADKSGNSNNVSQAVPTQQPVRFTTANGLTGLSYTASTGGTIDTGGQWFRGTFATPMTSNRLSVFMVGSMNSAAQQYGRAVSLSQLTSNDYIAGAGGINIARNSTANSLMMEANGASGPPTGAVTLATPFIAESIFNGANQTAFVNGTQTGTRAFTANFNIARSGIGFLSYQGVNTTTDRWDGTINEVLVYNTFLELGSRQTIEGYLAWKWGLQGSLPITHPYATVNPSGSIAVATTGLLIRFDATTYSGSGQWINTGSLGTANNATITAGQTPAKNTAGNGIVLNGSCGWTFPHIGLQTSYTLSSWFKLTAAMASDFLAYVTETTAGTTSINMALSGRNSGISVGTQGFAGGSYINPTWRIGTITNLTLNQWVMLSVSFDNTSKILATYINGISVGTTTLTGFTPATNNSVYRIGQQITGTAVFITGEVGQVLIYSRALTATELLQNYAATSSTFSV
jgi:hypothetical protein